MNCRAFEWSRRVAVLLTVYAMSMGMLSASEEGTYVEKHASLREAIHNTIPDIGEQVWAAYDAAREELANAQEALDAAQKDLGQINQAQGLVGHARNHWIRTAERNIQKAQEQLAAAETEEEREEAKAALASAEQNKQDGEDALKERQANLDALREKEPEFRAAHESAKADLEEAEAQLLQAARALPAVELLQSDRLDAQLVRFVVMEEWGPDEIAAYASQGDAQKALVDKLLADTYLMREMLVADGAKDGNYGRAMEIYTEIQDVRAEVEDEVLDRLALAIALEHATPISQRNPKAAEDAPEHVDPVARYLHFENAYLADELDPSFGRHDVWHYRWVVDGYEPDDILVWGREMLRNYRPDHIYTQDQRWRYVGAVRTEVPYGSQWNKYDRDELQFFQNILMNGGICGRRAFFGRFILRAFGVPTTARPSRGHGALVRWTPDGWIPVLGPGWGGGWTHTPYGDDLNFLYSTQARMAPESFLEVKRAQWIGRALGEHPVWGVGGRREPDRWHALALDLQQVIINDVDMATQDAVGEELGEADVDEDEVIEIPDADMTEEIVVHSDGTITIPAVATTSPSQSTSKIMFHKSFLGGRQLHYSRSGNPETFTYTVHAPQAGTYYISLRYVVNTDNQPLQLQVNEAGEEVEMILPLTLGMWEHSDGVEISLDEGENILTFSRSGENLRGLTIKDFTLTPID